MPDSHNVARWKMVRESRGSNTVLLFGLVSIALITVVGTAVDFSRLAAARNQLQERLDTALVAGAREDGDNRIEMAEAVFDQMATGSIAEATARHFDNDGGGLSGTVTAAVPTTLSSVIGIRTIHVVATGHASRRTARCVDPVIHGKDGQRSGGCAIIVRSSTRTAPAAPIPAATGPSAAPPS